MYKEGNIMKKKFGPIWVILLVLLDQVTKYWARISLKENGPIDVIKGVFSFEYLENKGIAFGLFQNKFVLFVIFTLIILAVLCFFYYRLPDEKRYRPLQICMIFIAAGAIGNMIDRVWLNYVVDFLYFNLINFPIFNIADCYVTLTLFVLAYLLLFHYKEEELYFYKKGVK
jgi:lipoprotein signal peptidase